MCGRVPPLSISDADCPACLLACLLVARNSRLPSLPRSSAINRNYGFYDFYGSKTNIRLELAFGKKRRRQRMHMVSNQVSE